jgi:hypothetical protein
MVLPPPDELLVSYPVGSQLLITDDGSEIAPLLVTHLAARGMNPILMRFPGSIVSRSNDLSADIRQIQLEDMTEEHLQSRLAEVAEQSGPIAGFIHLDPVTSVSSQSIEFNVIDKLILKHVFLLAKHLKQPLNTLSSGRPVFLSVVHLDGHFGMAGKVEFSPIKGGIFGLVKTLNLEWPSVFCRVIDLSPGIPAGECVSLIIQEYFDPNRLIVEVGYNHDGRTTLIATTGRS